MPLFLACFSWTAAAEVEATRIPNDSQVLRHWGRAERASVSRPLRIITWNIYKANGQDEWGRAIRSLRAEADLVLGQEGWMIPAFEQVMSEPSGFFWSFATAFTYRRAETGVFVGTRIAPTRFQWHRSPGREPVTSSPKMALSTELPLQDGRKLLVINVHALNFVLPEAFRSQIGPLFEMAARHRGPVVFGGDFNTWSRGRLNFLLQQAQAQGMSGVGFSDDARRMKLDHVFFRELGLVEARILTQISTSDHWPLLTVFEPSWKDRAPQMYEPRVGL